MQMGAARSTVQNELLDNSKHVSANCIHGRTRSCDRRAKRMREGRRLLMLAKLVVAATAVIFSRPLIPQPARYHDFADQRAFFGVPTFMDVVSNLPFLFVGVW